MRDLIDKRHSTRHYISTPVDQEVLRELMVVARRAPTAGGRRAYQTFITTDTQKVSEIARQGWIAQAPVVVVLCIDPERSAERYGDRGRNLYCIQDTTLYGAYLDLLLVDEGYGTCWVGAFNEEAMREFLDIPEKLRPISLLVVGKAGGGNHEE